LDRKLFSCDNYAVLEDKNKTGSYFIAGGSDANFKAKSVEIWQANFFYN
jgi:hypothetical protein